MNGRGEEKHKGHEKFSRKGAVTRKGQSLCVFRGPEGGHEWNILFFVSRVFFRVLHIESKRG